MAKYYNRPTNFYSLALLLIVLVAGVFYFAGNNFRLSGITGLATTASQSGNFSAGVNTYVACTWSNAALNVSFGSSLDPGANVNATGNYNLTARSVTNGTNYNVTVDTLSNVDVSIAMRGVNLTSGSNVIQLGNLTWQSNSTVADSNYMNSSGANQLNATYDTLHPLASSAAPGSTIWYRFWLNVPSGTVAGSYAGNYTQQCSQS
ncbi:MAG: hypothetical protein Q8R15_01470 [Candidatus Micrarchaeota archaeon]|nr:hypothetical protein [Candidatus Micrarchaeota archaeon]